MEENTVIAFRSPANFREDPLREVVQAGAHKLLAQAIETEVASFPEADAALVDGAGRRRVVRNGYLPERAIQTGIGPVSLRQPPCPGPGDGTIRFTSAILPALSAPDQEPGRPSALAVSDGHLPRRLFGSAGGAGTQAPGLSASTITRLKEVRQDELERRQRRDLTAKRYVHF